ncbi:hypothetical protein GCM10009836_11380 [Pseudonocardia ailaonensis]|uniref:Uncharacterized protein n=1 Tax=Pseudonocardia ailaonensis TaxID=367279 RepID=A0ABN2MR21_9PSEU
MTVAWGSLGVVALVSLVAGVALIVLVSFALVGLSARARPGEVGGAGTGAAGTRVAGARGMSPAAGTAVAVVCLLAAALIVGYGLWVLIA